MRNKQLQVLLLEDDAAHARVIVAELRSAGIDFISKVISTREQLELTLQDFTPDLILSDFYLPDFDGLLALSICQTRCPDVPFVFVTGVLGEELAIETLKHGATDYVLKTHLSRLVPAVHRALREAEERTYKKRLEQMLREEINGIEQRLQNHLSPVLAAIRNCLQTTTDSPVSVDLEKCLSLLTEAQGQVAALVIRIQDIEKKMQELKGP